MKLTTDRPFADIDTAMRKLLELANAMEADVGRLSVGTLNTQLIAAGASVAEYLAAMKAAIAHGYFTMHPSGGYVTFTQAGADLFA
jgi:acyl dehydratase